MLTRRSLVALVGALPLTRSLPQTISEDAPQPAMTRLIFGGDVMLSRHVGQRARDLHDPAHPLRDLAPVLAAADLAFVNLEAPFSDRGKVVEAGMVFKSEPEMIAALEIAGVDIVSTANNHARDCGSYGVEYTLDWLKRHGIAAVGTAPSAEGAHAGTILTRNGIRFGFLAYTYDQSNGNHADLDDRVAVMDPAQMRADVAFLCQRADVAIVSMHAGTEYAPLPNAHQKTFAQAAIDAGARIVVGHHPHVTQPWEYYREGVIFYSLGNLVFDQVQRADTQRGILAQVVFSGTVLTRAEVISVQILDTAPRLPSASPSGAPKSAAAASGGRSRA